MRVALVSPYSWTYPGGVTRHIEALAAQLLAAGHEVRVLAPFDHDGRRSARRPPRRAPAGARRGPDWLIPLGPTIGWPSNGAVSNLSHTPVRGLHAAPGAARRALRRRPRPRAGRARRRLGRADRRRRARWSGRSTATPSAPPPHAIANLMGARRKLNHLRGADRGLRGRRVDRPALLRRPLPGHPQRRGAPAARPPPRGARRASRCGSRSSARPSSARACPCCCAPSRRCAARSPPS